MRMGRRRIGAAEGASLGRPGSVGFSKETFDGVHVVVSVVLALEEFAVDWQGDWGPFF